MRDITNAVGIALAGPQRDCNELLALLSDLGFDIEYGSTTTTTEPGSVRVYAGIVPDNDRPGRWLTPPASDTRED